MRELWEDHESHREEGGAAGHGGIDHAQHTVRVPAHLRPVDRVCEVGLTGGGGVADMLHARSSYFAVSIGGTDCRTARVLYVSR